METYFQAARVPDTEKVSITSMYLTGDAKLWWRSRLSDDASANRERIETWEVLKKELKDQFLPCNTSWLARESLRNLSIQGRFTELRRQGVKDLPTAIAADRLGDYKVPNEPEQRSDDLGTRDRGRAASSAEILNTGARDCPKRGRLNAIVAEHTDSEQETGPARVGAMQLGTLQVQSRGCGEAHPKGLVMVPGRINGKKNEGFGDTGPRITLFLTGRPKAGAGRPNVGQSGEGCELKSGASKRVADAELCVGGDKPSFVKGEYDGVTAAGKKSGVAEARSSNASSSKEGRILLD
ncbi:UNVERIFIED_CONTAM: hypothetical protein Scaly_2563600 [Sesamum calycinum]|uniref:Retrotransposon gag domain-containing protein n=1 Tax=Sesamum calycinum TaxID=2727403 RepID=A0AAW2K810_9LAMI